MAAPQFSSKSPTIRRILREAAEISNAPSPDYTAEPLESDLFEWHFTIKGPPNSVYSEGFYHGRIVLPPTYPLRPPSFRFTTPSGRFEANREICLSISGHHEETWQPAWGIRTALVALRSFMETDARGQLGGLETTEEVRRRLASESGSFRCPVCARSNVDIIAESTKRSEEASAPSADVQVPAELSMGWRDEMGSQGQPGSDASKTVDKAGSARNDDSDGAELAEGFVQTSPSAAQNTNPNQQSSTSTIANVPQPRRAADQPPAAAAIPPLAAAAQTQYVTNARHHGDGVPLWIDRAIVALVIALAALVLKVLFGI